MKLLAPFEKLINPLPLIVINLAVILLAEFAGGGTFFAETGLVHAIAFLFVALILVRIFSDYAFSDYILKGFLKIQLAFFLFLGLVHVYEYVGLHVFMIEDEVIEFSATISYFLWILGMLLAIEFVSRIYYKKSAIFTAILGAVVALGAGVIVALNIEDEFVHNLPAWSTFLMLLAIVGVGGAGIASLLRIRKIMPIFKEFSYYAIPSIVLLLLTSIAEYFEATHTLTDFGVSEVQNLYIAHFFIYAALSLLLVGFGKLKKPQGIYADM
ncbi:MAG: hypothetical protein M0P64_01310 [Candidatus Pacebacteria bacterium]|jgi:predicted outer membrane lipoprotein|nr:hypothetical protein [Candidatus Paceibacterota bacterium]